MPLDLLLLNDWWMGATILSLVLISDYGLTLCGARLYRRIATRMAVEGSYESIPLFEADIDAGRLVSWRFIVALIVMVGALGLAARLGASFGIDEPLYLFLAGFLIFIEVPVHVQHLSNIARFSLLMHPDAAQGQISAPRMLTLPPQLRGAEPCARVPRRLRAWVRVIARLTPLSSTKTRSASRTPAICSANARRKPCTRSVLRSSSPSVFFCVSARA